MNAKAEIRYNSGYLVHLGALAQETAQRMRGVPPFQLLIAAALFAHIAIIAPVYLLNLANEVEEVTQIRVAFGVNKPKPQTEVSAARHAPSVASHDIVRNVDALFSPPQRKVREVVQRNPRSVQPNVVTPISRQTARPQLSQRNSVPKRPVSAAQRPSVAGAGGAASVREVVSKYERLLSGWIDRHKIYPDEAYRNNQQGQVVLRLRINRRGFVIFKGIERSSGNALLDRAVLETVTRASPMPTVPSEYPGGGQLEFLIPIQFRI